MATTVPIEIKFAQSLAGNEKKTRDKAIKKLREYFAAKSSSKKDGFTEVDLLKIWKGLHYCMWMQDKPLIQEEMSSNLCGLLRHLHKVDVQLMFIRTYFITEAREWNTIDKWRIDKFMMLYRDMLHASLDVVRRQDWEAGALQGLVAVYGDTVMDPENDRIPDGFKIHLADIYWDEVAKVGVRELDGEQLLVLLTPFIKYLLKTPNPLVAKRVVKSVFEPIIDQAVERVQETEEEEEEEEEKEYLDFDIKLLADHLFTLGQDNSKILLRNRPVLFDLVKRLRDVDSGVVPVEEEVEITPGITDYDFSKSVTDLTRLLVSERRPGKEEEQSKKKKKKKKNKKVKDGKSVEEKENDSKQHGNIPSGAIPDSQPEESAGEITVKGKRKRKLQMLTEDSDAPLTKLKKKSEESKDTDTNVAKTKKNKKSKKNEKVEEEANTIVEMKKDKKNKKNKNQEKEETATKKSKKGEKQVNEEIEDNVKTVTKKGKKSKKLEKGSLKESDKDTKQSSVGDSVTPSIPAITLRKPSDDLEEGDVEIWVPNKKYKGNKSPSSKSTFASFDSSKQPVAFVKKALQKVGKKTPKSARLETPGTPTGEGSAKSVIFNMKKNKSISFKDSVSSPMTPYNPERRPDQGILKTPNSRNGTPNTGSVATPVSRLLLTPANPSPLTRDTRTHLTPGPKSQLLTNSSGSNATKKGVKKGAMKKMTPTKRAKAADFFML